MAQGYLIAFDNSVLSPLVRARMGVKISQVDQQRGERAEALIDRILAHNSHAKTVQDHVRLVIPTLSLAENLCGFPQEEQDGVTQIVKTFAQLAEFNELAATVLGTMYREIMTSGGSLPKGHDRQVAKHDFSIAASALAANVRVLYHGDSDYKALSALKICKNIKFEQLPAKNAALFG